MSRFGVVEREQERSKPVAYSRKAARAILYTRLILGDALALFIGYSLANKLREAEWLAPGGVNLIWVILPIYLLLTANAKGFSFETVSSFTTSVRRSLIGMTQSFLLVFALIFLTSSAQEISRVAVGVMFFGTIVSMTLLRYLAYRWVRGELQARLQEDLVILDGALAPRAASSFVINADENDLLPDLNDPKMVERFARATDAFDRVLVACPHEKRKDWAILLKTIDAKGEFLMGGPDDLGAIGVDNYAGQRTVVVSRGSLSMGDRIKKRLFDLAIAVPALLFLAPLLIVVAVLIKLDSRGPVFFRQPRVGRNNAPFQIYKFRSMRQERSDVAGAQSTRRDDDRISRFGGFLRRTSIDELPQLFNVVRGEMSIVGPRPHALGSTADDQLFWEISHRYWERHALKPGITGLAQVRGFRGATERTRDLTDRLQSDLEYLVGWDVWRDLGILLATLKVVVHPNAY